MLDRDALATAQDESAVVSRPFDAFATTCFDKCELWWTLYTTILLTFALYPQKKAQR